MPETILYEELDDATRKYLGSARAVKGKRMPGMFAATANAAPVLCLVGGLVLIPLTLVATLTDMIDVVYDDPVRVALLQMAGLLPGGWLLLAYFRFRGTQGNARTAGHWVYMDALHLYVAHRELVTVYPLEHAVQAKVKHNFNQGKYQNSTVTIYQTGGANTPFTINDELRAEQCATFINYVAWARGGEGGEIGALPPATLGALARYVARHDVEPRDAEGKLNFELLDVDAAEVPAEPKREGRAAPALAPYAVMLVAVLALFPVLAFVVNPTIRDDAIFSAVMHKPTEPRFLRAYLSDSRNTLHRQEVLKELSAHYIPVINQVRTNAQQPELRDGMLAILESLREEPESPIVSLRVTERSPEALAAGAPARVKRLREGFVGGDGLIGPNRDGVLDVFARVSPAIKPPDGVVFPVKPPPIGHQLLDFVEPPDDAPHAHIQITYEFRKQADLPDTYLLAVTVEIRKSVDADPIATYSKDLSTVSGGGDELDKSITALRDTLVQWMVGSTKNPLQE